jgi:hypothetical protein
MGMITNIFIFYIFLSCFLLFSSLLHFICTVHGQTAGRCISKERPEKLCVISWCIFFTAICNLTDLSKHLSKTKYLFFRFGKKNIAVFLDEPSGPADTGRHRLLSANILFMAHCFSYISQIPGLQSNVRLNL